MDYLTATVIALGIIGVFFCYRKWLYLPRCRRQQVFDSLPQPPSRQLADFKGDSDQYMNYLMEHGMSPTEVAKQTSLPPNHVYEALRDLVQDGRIEILFLKESSRINYFQVGPGRLAMVPLIFRKGLPENLTPDKQEMLALLDLECKKS